MAIEMRRPYSCCPFAIGFVWRRQLQGHRHAESRSRRRNRRHRHASRSRRRKRRVAATIQLLPISHRLCMEATTVRWPTRSAYRTYQSSDMASGDNLSKSLLVALGFQWSKQFERSSALSTTQERTSLTINMSGTVAAVFHLSPPLNYMVFREQMHDRRNLPYHHIDSQLQYSISQRKPYVVQRLDDFTKWSSIEILC
jgi:hypothetical protein